MINNAMHHRYKKLINIQKNNFFLWGQFVI